MPAPVAGIDPHQHSFTVGIVNPNGAELVVHSFANSADGYLEAIELLDEYRVEQVGIEGSGGWGAHISIAIDAAGFDSREVPPGRTAAQRRTRRQAKTDAIDAVCIARALLAEPDLPGVHTLDVYDPLVAKIEAVLEHRRMLVEARTLVLQHIQAQLNKLPVEIRDQLAMTGKIEQRLRQLEHIDTSVVSTIAGEYRLSWLVAFIEHDTALRSQIRQLERDLQALLDEHGTTLRDEVGISHIAAANLLVEVGNPFRFATEAKFSRWCGVSPIAMSSAEGNSEPIAHRLDFGGNRRINSVLYVASIVQHRDHQPARDYIARKLSEGKTRKSARRCHKRHLANRVIRRMWNDETHRQEQHPPTTP